MTLSSQNSPSERAPRLKLGAGRRAVEHHYDVGNEFYACWLDDSMTYSSALGMETASSLEAAQAAKLDFLLDAARLPAGGRLLDIGCGWGSLLARARERDPAAHLAGLTLSPAQLDHIRTTAAAAELQVELSSWIDHDPPDAYDAIVSIGAFEHFAPSEVTEEERVSVYRTFFERCFGMLRRDGRLCLQTIALEGEVENPDSRGTRFFAEEIFPDTGIPRLKEIVLGSDATFKLVGFRSDPHDYALTCREWRRRLLAHRSEAERVVGTDVVRRYQKFLLMSEMQFVSGALTLLRLVLERRADKLGATRPRAGEPAS